MHDIDGTLLRGVQSEWESDNEFEWEGEADNEFEADQEYEFESADEFEFEGGMESEEGLAAELMELESEEEVEQFLGDLVKSAGRQAAKAAGKAYQRVIPHAKVAGRFLYDTAKPHLKQAMIGFGHDLVDKGANRLFGEVAGTPKDRQRLNIAKRVIKVAQDTGRQVVRIPPNVPPAAVKSVVIKTCRRYFPNGVSVAPSSPYAPAAPAAPAGTRGTWIRRGNHIILQGL